jgi:hypothetical protein
MATFLRAKSTICIGRHSNISLREYELGVHEPSFPTVKLLANVLEVPPSFMYCEEEDMAALLLALHKIPSKTRKQTLGAMLDLMSKA